MTTARFAGGSLALALLALLAARDPEHGFIPILDHANLVFHEAGHVFFGLLGETARLYGGTLGQFVFPILTVAIFSWRRNAVAVALCGAWGCENLFNVARYMADAKTQVLPLVGGDMHDWAIILARWGVIHSQAMVANVARVTRVVGWLGLATLWMALLYRWWRDRAGVR